MHVKFNDLNQQWKTIKYSTIPRLDKLFQNSQYINGEDVQKFEYNFAQYLGVKYFIGTSNGTDAITLAIKAITTNTKDLILIPANTFIATALGAYYANNNADIKLIDCNKYHQIDIELLEKEISKNRHKYSNCIIIGVHLFGHCCDVENILKICEQYNCVFVEDSAQAHGTLTNIGKCGSIGKLAAFSFYPGKNLGACGDAGGIATNDEELYYKLKSLGNLGTGKNKYEYIQKGYNHRLDTIQAIILDEKLKYLDKWNSNRTIIARVYNEHLDHKINKVPKAIFCKRHTYHLYVVEYENRDGLMDYLKSHNIETGVHYPIAIEQTGIFNIDYINYNTIKKSQIIISLPIHPFMTTEEALFVCEKINEYINR